MSIYMESNSIGMDEKKTTKTRSYTIAFKMNVLNKWKELNGNISATARYFVVPRACVQDWIKKEAFITSSMAEQVDNMKKSRNIPTIIQKKRKRTKYPHLEESLIEWIEEERSCGKPVTAATIKAQADKIFSQVEQCGDIKPSKAWLGKFVKRHNITH